MVYWWSLVSVPVRVTWTSRQDSIFLKMTVSITNTTFRIPKRITIRHFVLRTRCITQKTQPRHRLGGSTSILHRTHLFFSPATSASIRTSIRWSDSFLQRHDFKVSNESKKVEFIRVNSFVRTDRSQQRQYDDAKSNITTTTNYLVTITGGNIAIGTSIGKALSPFFWDPYVCPSVKPPTSATKASS